MSQETKQETLNSDSSYWELDSHNAQRLLDTFKVFFPMLSDTELFDFLSGFAKIIAFEQYRKKHKVTYNQLLEYIADLETIKKMGYGEVRTRVRDGKITSIEGIYTRQYVIETTETTK